jgi:signal transduction histidine kinase
MIATAISERFFTGRPRSRALFDVALAAAVFAGSLALLAHGDAFLATGRRAVDAIAVVLAACSAAPLVAWRRQPYAVFVASAVVCTLLAALGYPIGLTIGPTVALYLLAASRSPSVWTAATVVALFVMYLGALAAARGRFPEIALLHTCLAWTGAWFAGERTRLRRDQVAQLHDRALRAERDADRERLLAVAEERARIARDLHDSAAHAISVIAVRAGAARLRHHQDPDRSLSALQAVEELARQTVAEIDQIVGTLRDRPVGGAVEAPSGLASLGTLIAHHAAAGLKVSVHTDGDTRPLTGAADQAAYRILQEALTNAARHGTGSARVDMAYTDTSVRVIVTNPVRPGMPARVGGGHGLIGMRERAAALGGSLDTGRVDGVYRVHAQIPHHGHRI